MLPKHPLRGCLEKGDLDEASYRQRRADLQNRLATLPEATEDRDGAVGERLATWLTDLSVAWREAVPAERNRIARELFDGVRIEQGTVRMMRPRSILLPFFEVLQFTADDRQAAADTDEVAAKNTDAAGDFAPAASGGAVNAVTQLRKRRGLTAPLRNEDGWIAIAEPADNDSTNREYRYTGELSQADRIRVHALANSLSPRNRGNAW